MSKQIKFTFDGVDYTLEFTKQSIKEMERDGFNINEVGDKPMTDIPAFFAGAFKAHHRFTKRETIDEIYAAMPDKDKLFQALAEMYTEPINNLMAEPDSKKKVEWNTTF